MGLRFTSEVPLLLLLLLVQFRDMGANPSTNEGQDAAADAYADRGLPRIRARVFNLRDPKRMRLLDPADIDTLVSIKGMVIRTSEVIPEMKRGYFRCTQCGWNTEVDVDRGRLDEPSVCESCHMRHSMELLHNRCSFMDKQMIKLQETPDSIPEGETPMTVQVRGVACVRCYRRRPVI